MTVVYIDSVFALNMVMDYLLLLMTARLSGIPLRRRRYLLAALLGGLYAAAVFLPGCGFLAGTAMKIVSGVLLALIAFGGEEKLLRLTLLLFALSCALAGCVLAFGLIAGSTVPAVNGIFYTDVDGTVLLIAAASAYLVGTLVFRAAARLGIRGERLAVRVGCGGRICELAAMWDTGNTLCDPVDGQPVLTVAPGGLDRCLSHEVRALLTPERLRTPAELLEPLRQMAPELRPRLIPYHSVGLNGGMLLLLRTDWVEIGGERMERASVALSPTALGDGYSALWGGRTRGEDRNGKSLETAAEAFGAAGTAAGGEHSLHWRQRRSAAAAESGAGSGGAGPSGG